LVKICRDRSLKTISAELALNSAIVKCPRALHERFKVIPDGCIEADSRESVETFIDECCNRDLRALGYVIKIVKAVS